MSPTSDQQSAVLADLAARTAAVQHEIEEAERRIHPPHHATFADPDVDGEVDEATEADAAFALDGSQPKPDERRRLEQLHEDDEPRP